MLMKTCAQFISYALAEPITNVLLKRLTPRIFFTGIIIAWGVVMTLMGLVTSYGGLLAARFALGLAEAGLYPVRYLPLVWKALLTFRRERTITCHAGTRGANLVFERQRFLLWRQLLGRLVACSQLRSP